MEGRRTANPTSRSVLGRGQSVGRDGASWPRQGKPHRESPALRVFCNPLDHFPPSFMSIFASR